ncbi:unnamed protein product [Trifolium pratense]|uniref:Uncharacterized protein n=1 Tax=Trifolium pratense TaxID=57577 RepID=A0ACB0LY63_TRIPR|nr:unnamed protein product [Trifolium pratense]
MDTNSSNKSQKNYEGDGKNFNRILSDLPDEMLQKIITYISIKEAVATSILSTRWKYQWIGNYKSNMELNEGLFSKRQDFIDFAEKLYKICNNSNPQKVSLILKVGNEFRRVNKWLSAFVNPMIIEELNLELDGIKNPLVLPNEFFTSKTLTIFQLSMRQVIKIPSSTINFQKLVTLTLKNVIFPNHHCTQKFFVGLPSLKELTLIECDWKKVGSLTIICEVLQKLFIREWENEENVEEQNDHDHRELGFHAPKLLTFSYDGDLINYYFLFSTTSITDASIEVNENNNSTLQADYFVSKLFPSLIGVERLSISDFALEAFFQAPDLATNLPTSFHHLVVLRVVSSSPLDLSCQGLQTILQRSSFLQEIEFDVQFAPGVFLDANDENEIKPLPECFKKHLKIIKIHGFCGAANQLNAIKFLLKTTRVLDRLYIHGSEYYFDSHEGRQKLERFYVQILRFRKASLGCIINLE